MQKLKIGIIVDDMHVPKYYYDLIHKINNNNIFYTPVIINQNIGIYKKLNLSIFSRLLGIVKGNSASSILRSIFSRIIIFIESRFLLKNVIYANYDLNVSIDKKFEVLNVNPDISKSGFVYRYDNNSIQSIKDLDLDLMLRFGSGILKGNVLKCCKFGILSLHHGDNREFRGTPSGFWEVFYSKPSTGFIIQQLTEELDAGKVLYRGNIMTASYWLKNRANISIKSMVFLYKLLENIANKQSLPAYEDSANVSEKLYKYPSLKCLIRYFLLVHAPAAIKILRNFFFHKTKLRWRVLFLKNTKQNMNLCDAKNILNPENSFLADPFVVDKDDQTFCFVEEFCYKENKGKISSYILHEDGAIRMGTAIEENFHLSFPYIIEHDQDLYMIPESASNRDIRLYKNISFPNEWVLEEILMRDIDAADTVVFFQDNYWYMLTNICSSNISDHQSELHLFSSKSLISNQWMPAETNPIIFNSLKARNGGCFYQNGYQYRVNQVHAKSHYGQALEINKIINISPSSYAEEKVLEITPDLLQGAKSTHHFDKSKHFIVFDCAKEEII